MIYTTKIDEANVNSNQPQDFHNVPLGGVFGLLPDEEYPTKKRPNDVVEPNNAVSDPNTHRRNNRDASRSTPKKSARERGKNTKNRRKQKVEDSENESEDPATHLDQITLIELYNR